ncbi:MAG: PH domain-containing protein [Candidatus Hydrogenedentota bacterium]
MADNVKVLLEVRPSWWNYFGWLLLALIFLGGGIALSFYHTYLLAVCLLALIPLAVAMWKRLSLHLMVDEQQVELTVGLLSISRHSVYCSDIRAANTRQSLLQRLVGIGDVMIGSAGTEGWEIIAPGLPDPKGVEDIIENQKHKKTGGSND